MIVLIGCGCGPEAPAPGGSDSATQPDEATLATTVASSSSSSSSTVDGTTASTSDGATSSTGGPLSPCRWEWPEDQGLTFCPAPPVGETLVQGTTPLGEVSFTSALFGLQRCGCPSPVAPSLWLYDGLPGPDPGAPTRDVLSVDLGEGGGFFGGSLRVGGMGMGIGPGVAFSFEFIEVPTDEDTAPPLDEDAPPRMIGIVTATGSGWKLGGTVTASLCTELDWEFPCE